MSFKIVTLASALVLGVSGAALAAPYHPGYSTSDIRLQQKEAAVSTTAVGTHGSAAQASASSGVYTPGYSDSDVRLMERTSSHTLPHTSAVSSNYAPD
ncbi:hypothetical protein [Methylobrevis pamukkalensis]|uniref:DUF4148 domain-containing protein n=1 Tax=Methylobrevis pamukkalensis TaxID=1439726 RepID=A0A1E3H802_9HYPH|nr:hypothetical protein [Methylobrevis pamukkalensis]ODN72458.1 hypothetical protein A6302_00204 [Methylobrevis pamukkalensis]